MRALALLLVLAPACLGAPAFAFGPGDYGQPVCVVSNTHVGDDRFLVVTNDPPGSCGGWILMQASEYAQMFSTGSRLTMENVRDIVQATMLVIAVAWGFKWVRKAAAGLRG